ncbi:MAG: hypothetical protein ACPGF7_13655 [Pontibacterium sp.]
MKLIEEVSRVLLSYVEYGLHGGLGAGGTYLYYYMNQKKPFAWTGLLVFVFLGAVTANIIGPFIPVGMVGRDGLLVGIGFIFWPILGLLSAKGPAIAERLAGMVMK